MMELVNHRYQIGGVDLLDICKEYDSPVYVYDAGKILEQYSKLETAFSSLDVRIKYACKALSNINILKLLRNRGAGLDVVSIQEAELGLKAGYKPEDILFTPNCVSFEEIQKGVEMGLVINIDNISILEQFGHVYGDKVPCCIRFNPHIAAGGNANIQTGHIDSKFGISVHQFRHVQRLIEANKMHIIGLHVHTGSDILNTNAFLQGAEIIFDLALDFKELQFIDFGSGFKVAYREGDVVTNVDELGEKLTAVYEEFRGRYGRDVEIWFEPGKFLVSESGYLLVKTNVLKPTPATVFVGVDSGLNHLIRPMMYGAYHHITNISNPSGTPRIYTIVGYICETDTFGWDRKLNEVREGDILAIHNAGAYGISMASNYNSRFRPAEVLVYEGKAHLIRKRETLEDITRNMVEIEF